MLAAYAIGSLAHGGFSAYVSDVDLAIVLETPTRDADAVAVSQLCAAIRATGLPLAERLSVFWTGRDFATGAPARFPAADLLDLKRDGRLLRGTELRDEVPTPTPRELLVEGASFAHARLATEDGLARVHDPGSLMRSGLREATKFVLFPVRLLHTARTGSVGINHRAVAAYGPPAPPAAVALARAALAWRERPAAFEERAAVDLMRDGLQPLYRHFVRDHGERLRSAAEPRLAGLFETWARRLG